MSSHRKLLITIWFIAFVCHFNILAASATLLAVNKGWCLTYDQSRPGTLVTFSRCRSSAAIGNQSYIGDHFDLLKRKPAALRWTLFLISQQSKRTSSSRFTNALSRSNVFARALYGLLLMMFTNYFYGAENVRGPPRYIGIRHCSDSYRHIILNVMNAHERDSFKVHSFRNAFAI